MQAPLDDLVRDFRNPRTGDQFLHFVRNKDWFDGHSWTSGYTFFAAGKNQVGGDGVTPRFFPPHWGSSKGNMQQKLDCRPSC